MPPDAPSPPPADAADAAVEELADAVAAPAEGAAEAADEAAEKTADAAGELVEEAADLGGATPDDGGEEAVRLLNDFQEIPFWQIGLIVLGTWATIAAVRRVVPYLADRGPGQLRLSLLGAVPIARLALLVAAALWIAPLVFNINVENFLVIAGAAGLAVGFAFKDYVSSLIAGVVAVVERPYRPGDWVKIGETYGEVIAVGLRTVQLNTPADDVVNVPHLKIWSDPVVNSNDGARTLLCTADFHLAPDHDAAAVRAALADVGLTSAYLDWGRPVAVMLSETPWGTHYKLKAYPFDMRDQFAFVSDLTVRGKAAVRAAGAAQVSAAAPGPAVE